MLDLCPITIFTTTTTMSRAALKEAQAKIKQLEDEKEARINFQRVFL